VSVAALTATNVPNCFEWMEALHLTSRGFPIGRDNATRRKGISGGHRSDTDAAAQLEIHADPEGHEVPEHLCVEGHQLAQELIERSRNWFA
jgi:hypothetical protein